MKRYSKEFGKKEKVLNYATQTYQLSRPNKVGASANEGVLPIFKPQGRHS